MCKRAVILAGGKGTRLRPYTVVLPKPLMPLGDYPVLEVIVRQLARHGFGRITMAVNHQAELIKAFFGDGSRWGVEVDYSLEDRPLGTMAPLRLIADLPDDFLVMNGDVLTDRDFSGFHDLHVSQQNRFTISAHQRAQMTDYGVLEMDADGSLSGFREKPVVHYHVSMGIYMVSRSVLDLIPEDGAFGFDSLMTKMIEQRIPVAVSPHVGYWRDIGRPDDYMNAIDEFEQMRSNLLDG